MEIKKSVLASITLIILLILCGSCTNNQDNPILYSPFGEMPVVTGLYFVGEAGPEFLAVWGNPSGRSLASPTIGDYTKVHFVSGGSTTLKIWVVPARLPQQKSSEIVNLMNAHYDKVTGLGVATLVDGIKTPGYYEIIYNFVDSDGNTLPEGFYRIYIQVGDILTWCDVLNFRNESNYYKVLVNQIYDQLTYIGRP